MRTREDGFTLIELLVVIIVIAILAAIAIPVFVNQRQKGYAAQVQSALKNASTAIEAYAADNGGDYSGLETVPDLAATLADNGFDVPSWALTFDVVAVEDNYCIEIRHAEANASTGWRRGTYFGDRGAPGETPDHCPGAGAL
ncbi:MAG TPA: prepilin-type N-terminal cleavage/methylation domain-containing protein [Actinomycetota bacterium]|nr:prepilin-type N-terminal cleavage/methylation domain-containing protein [Actinomycetota bacterium]